MEPSLMPDPQPRSEFTGTATQARIIPVSERRKTRRFDLETFLESDVLCGDLMRKAQVVNVSAEGLGLQAETNRRFTPLKPGVLVHFDIFTPYGRACRSGRVMWYVQKEGRDSWGLKFTKKNSSSYDAVDMLHDRIRAA